MLAVHAVRSLQPREQSVRRPRPPHQPRHLRRFRSRDRQAQLLRRRRDLRVQSRVAVRALVGARVEEFGRRLVGARIEEFVRLPVGALLEELARPLVGARVEKCVNQRAARPRPPARARACARGVVVRGCPCGVWGRAR